MTRLHPVNQRKFLAAKKCKYLCTDASPYTVPLLPPVLLHSKNLNHADEDVDEVQLKRNGLIDRVLGNQATLSHAGMVEYLLHIVQSESTKNSETTVQPDILGEHQSTGSGSREDHRSETGDRNNGDAGKERATKVHVLVCLCGGTDKSERAHHASSVESGASKDGGVHEEEGRQKQSLGTVERGPEGVFLDVAKMSQYFPLQRRCL